MFEENKNPVGRPQAYATEKEMWDKIKEYFDVWELANRPITVVGMALWLNITKSTLFLYERGDYDTPNEQFSNTVKKAKMYIENAKWEGALTGKYIQSVAIFDLKVNHRAIEYGKMPEDTKKPEEKEAEEEQTIDISNIDLSGLSDEEVRVMADFRRILKKATPTT